MNRVFAVMFLAGFVAYTGYYSYKFKSEVPVGSARKISSLNNMSSLASEENVSMQATEFIKEIHSVMNVEQMDKFVTKHVAILEKARRNNTLGDLSNDYKIMAAYLYGVKDLRGVGYRLHGLAESDKNKHYNKGIASDLMIIKLQNIASHINLYYPAFGDVAFDWIALPTATQKKDFKFVSDIQDFMMSTIYADLQLTKQIFDSVEISITSPVTMDAILLTGSKNVMTPDKRYYNIYPHALEAMKSNIESQSHDLIIFSQYNRDDYFNYQYKQSSSMFNIVPAQYRVGRPKSEVVSNLKKWNNLYTLREIGVNPPAGYDTWMLRAWEHVKSHVDAESRVVELMKEVKEVLSPEEAWQAIANPYIVSLYKKNPTNLMSKRSALVNKENVVLRSWVTGDVVSVNLPKFYTNPPEDLKAFLPTSFDTNAKKRFKYNGKDLVNYRYGMPNSWNVQEWSKYFPSVKSNDDIRVLTGVLNRSSEAPVVGAIVNKFVSASK